jgi:hypothetical protein
MYSMGLLGNKYGSGRHRNVLLGNTDVEVGYCILCTAIYASQNKNTHGCTVDFKAVVWISMLLA